MRGNKLEKSHIQNFTMRLPNKPIMFANSRPMFTICQHFYSLGVEVYLTRIGDFTWGLSDCEELVGGTHRR